jgi:hypothetical protein
MKDKIKELVDRAVEKVKELFTPPVPLRPVPVPVPRRRR